jgi:hypothetical protein
MESILTNYTCNCAICGVPNAEPHHLLFNRASRKLADEDKLVLPMCRICHEELHTKSSVAAELSRICGQLAYEKALCEKGMSGDDAREQFRIRYGISYL